MRDSVELYQRLHRGNDRQPNSLHRDGDDRSGRENRQQIKNEGRLSIAFGQKQGVNQHRRMVQALPPYPHRPI